MIEEAYEALMAAISEFSDHENRYERKANRSGTIVQRRQSLFADFLWLYVLELVKFRADERSLDRGE